MAEGSLSDERLMSDIALMGVCDQLTDEGLAVLNACAEEDAPLPKHIAAQLTDAGAELVRTLLKNEYGRLQIIDAVAIEVQERGGN